MEARHGLVGRVWIADRGMASAANLAWLRDRAMRSCGKPISKLAQAEAALRIQKDQLRVRRVHQWDLPGQRYWGDFRW